MTSATTVEVGRMRRIQAGARATLALGIGASLTANMMAADPSLIGRLVAGWSPVALMLTVELLSRVPASTGRLSRLRVTAAGAIAAIAAWVSYWHMVEVSLTAGESAVAAHLLPLSVDGLVIVASICLVEITNRLNTGPTTTARAARAPHIADQGETVTAAERPALTSPAVPSPQRPARTPMPRSTTNRSGSIRPSVGDQVRRLAAEHPDWSQAELAVAAGCSVRTIRRHLTSSSQDPVPAPSRGPATSGNGHTHRNGAAVPAGLDHGDASVVSLDDLTHVTMPAAPSSENHS